MLLWFRTDLRVHDNPALTFALQNQVKQAVYIATPAQWREHHLAPIKIDFTLRHVALLKAQLSALGIKLLVLSVDSYDEQWRKIADIVQENQYQGVIFNQEVELNEQLRDQKLSATGIPCYSFEADVIVPKGQIKNNQGEMFKVFTPFKKAWLRHVLNHGFDYQLKTTSSTNIDTAELPTELPQISRADSSQWPLADQVETQVLPVFLQTKLAHYEAQRDIPGVKGTSGLSAYLNIGAISSRYLLRLLLNQYPDLLLQQPPHIFSWLNEIIWREFYRHLLYHFPDLIKGRNFNAKYDELPWPNNEKHIQAWQTGTTGYPIVDAAMRQLNQTGWMHNRLRMIVASFLTKHLLVDWRVGEAYFMQHLIDGDFPANNGGWQWSAGTGCDAQPYFRVFNPITQSQKFDPSGTFIRKYLPELADIPDKHIHFPHQYIKDNKLSCYWGAIVEHKQAREMALNFYKENS